MTGTQGVKASGKTAFLSEGETGGKSHEQASDAFAGKTGLNERRFCVRKNKDRNRNKRFCRNRPAMRLDKNFSATEKQDDLF
ncbi:hypothetical protein OFAG_02301 [Oxalobacter formigenes HOxBLS]|uniref:Uncharacterized protein n=1 Tax=Oxalobacter paraformigenes TaxID=556268 RepID=T5LUH3_9BURK|nr:hypothetical protein OFAG_02301 [Oxalobacter paraformigenes]